MNTNGFPPIPNGRPVPIIGAKVDLPDFDALCDNIEKTVLQALMTQPMALGMTDVLMIRLYREMKGVKAALDQINALLGEDEPAALVAQ